MHDALGMDDDIHPLHDDIKKPACLDHFECLVEKGRGIHRDLTSHIPSRMA